jgi:hypothetical protein
MGLAHTIDLFLLGQMDIYEPDCHFYIGMHLSPTLSRSNCVLQFCI